MKRRRLWAVAVAVGIVSMPAAAQVTEPEGYRAEDYLADTPATLAGARVIGASALHAMMQAEPVIVIDVFPQPPRPEGLPAGTLWRPPARRVIPGAVWLANTGYGALNEELAAYFQSALEALTLGDKWRPLVFYCDARCWMSWNAAKRALSLGYHNVHWFPGGIQDWTAAGYPTIPAMPAPPK